METNSLEETIELNKRILLQQERTTVMMGYTINRTRRNLIILCSLFLILFKIALGLYYFFIVPTHVEPLQSGFVNLLYLIPYGYLMLVFIDYFKQTQLKTLQILTIIILSSEVVTSVCSFIFSYNPLITPRILFAFITAIWFIALIVWTDLLFMPKIKDYPAIFSVRYFALGLLLYIVLGMVPMFHSLIKPENAVAFLQWVGFTSAIPFIFSLNFGLKIEGEKIMD